MAERARGVGATGRRPRRAEFPEFLATRLGVERSSRGGFRSAVKELADYVGVSVDTVHGWLAGKDVYLGRRGFRLLSVYFGLDPDTARYYERKTTRERAASSAGTRQPVEDAQRAVRSALRQAGDSSRELETTKATPATPLPGGGELVMGTQDIIDVAVELLSSAAVGAQGAEVAVTYQGSSSVFDAHPSALKLWHQAARSVMDQGVSIHALWRVDDANVSRSALLVRDMVALMGLPTKGAYKPRLAEHDGVIDPPYDLLIVGHSALLMFAAANRTMVDTGLFFTDRKAVAALRAHFALLCENERPFVDVLAAGTEAHLAGLEAERQSRSRFLVKDGLSTITRPLSWFGEPAESLRRTHWREGPGFDAWREQEQVRLTTFLHSAASGADYRDICPRSAIVKLLREGAYYAQDGVQDPDRSMRSEHVRNVIHLLRLPGYQLALVDKAEEERIAPSWWAVYDDDVVIMHVKRPPAEGKLPVHLRVRVASVAKAFRSYFYSLWDSISPAHRDARSNTAWLRRQLKATTASHGSGE